MSNNKTFLQIPKYILENKELDGDNKILLSKIIELHNRGNGCYASNNTFGDLIGMSRTSVSKRITKLKNLGYITTKDVWENGQQKGRICTPTFKKGSSQSSRGIVPEVKGGSSPSSKGVVPEVGTNIKPLTYNKTYNNTGADKPVEVIKSKSSGISIGQYFKNKIN
jgi:biotin operon repressor